MSEFVGNVVRIGGTDYEASPLSLEQIERIIIATAEGGNADSRARLVFKLVEASIAQRHPEITEQIVRLAFVADPPAIMTAFSQIMALATARLESITRLMVAVAGTAAQPPVPQSNWRERRARLQRTRR